MADKQDVVRTSIKDVVIDVCIDTKVSAKGNPYNVYVLKFKSGYEKQAGFVDRAEKYMIDDMIAKHGTADDPSKLDLTSD